MLDLLRGFSKGWLAKILIALLALSFAIWGISGSIIFGGQYNVVQVGETKVDASQYRFAYENQLLGLSQSIGRRLTRQEADSLGLRESVLSQVVAGAVLDENARKMGLGISGSNLATDISNDPTFRDLSGQFSRERLRSALSSAGLTEEDYIQSRKRVSLRNQILDGTSASLSMPQAYLDALKIFQNEARVFEYVEIGDEVAGDIPAPTDSQLTEYYDSNKTAFIAPEYRKIAILKLEPSDVMKPDEVTEEEVQSAYENQKTHLRTPERRQVQQLVLANKEAAEAAKQRLSDGASFDEVVAENGKSISDIELGMVTRSELPDEKIAEAAFSASLNEPKDIVDGLFGPVILRITQINEERTTPFEEIEDTLRNQIAADRAIEDVFASFDAVEDERGAGEEIIPTGEKLGLTTRTISAIDVNGLDTEGKPVADIPQLRDLLSEAFQASPGDDTQAIEIGENGFLWFEVLEITPQRQKDFDEVKEQVRDQWIASETGKTVKKVADKIADRIRAGSDFNTVLAEDLPADSLGQPVKLTKTPALQRNSQDGGFPSAALSAGFAEKNSSTSVVSVGDTRQIVFKLVSIENTNSTPLPDDFDQRINLAASQDILSQVVEHLQARDSVSVNRAAIDLAFAPYGGNQHGY